MALAQSVVELIEDRIHGMIHSAQACPRVKTVRLEIGALSCVEPEAIRFCFDLATRGTRVEGAALDIIELTGSAWCFDCRRHVSLTALGNPCVWCGGFQLRAEAGTSMRVKEFELE
jgi:hydrogenase nickel incorporation protein HypA/HybF